MWQNELREKQEHRACGRMSSGRSRSMWQNELREKQEHVAE